MFNKIRAGLSPAIADTHVAMSYFVTQEINEIEKNAQKNDKNESPELKFEYVELSNDLKHYTGLFSRIQYDLEGNVLKTPRRMTANEISKEFLGNTVDEEFVRDRGSPVTIDRAIENYEEIMVANQRLEYLPRAVCIPVIDIESPQTQKIIANCEKIKGLNSKTKKLLQRTSFKSPLSIRYPFRNDYTDTWTAHRRVCEVNTYLFITSMEKKQFDVAWKILLALVRDPWIELSLIHGPILELLALHDNEKQNSRSEKCTMMLHWFIMNYPVPKSQVLKHKPHAQDFVKLEVLMLMTAGEYYKALTQAQDRLVAPPYSSDPTLYAYAGLCCCKLKGKFNEAVKYFKLCEHYGGTIPPSITDILNLPRDGNSDQDDVQTDGETRNHSSKDNIENTIEGDEHDDVNEHDNNSDETDRNDNNNVETDINVKGDESDENSVTTLESQPDSFSPIPETTQDDNLPSDGYEVEESQTPTLGGEMGYSDSDVDI